MGRSILFRLVIIPFWALLASIEIAHAQSGHLAQYKEYNAAIESGDLAKAASHAEAAWRAAEEELGDHQTTAILAYNFANLIYYARSADAIEPLERVIKITGERHDMFGAEHPVIMLVLARAYSDNESAAKKEALRSRLEQAEGAGWPPNLLGARAWLHLGVYDLSRKRYGQAEQIIDYALRHYRAYERDLAQEMAVALTMGGVSRVAGRSRNKNDIVEAAALFDEAIDLFPPQVGIDSFNPLLAMAIAWHSATDSANMADTAVQNTVGTHIPKRPPELSSEARVKWTKPRPKLVDCSYEFDKRKLPRFPDADARRGYLGAVLIGFHIRNARAVDARILAEVPQESEFGERSLKAVADWTLEQQPLPECASDLLVIIEFTIK